MNLTILSTIPFFPIPYLRIEEQILSGELSAEFKLPSERKLAAELKVHRNTVIKAYHKLINKELVIASQNPKGYFIKSVKNTMNFGKRFFPLEKAFKYECRWAEKTFNKFYWESENKNIISFSGMVMPRNLNSVEGMHHIVDKIFNSRENDNMSGFYRETKHLKQNICNLLTKENIYVTYKNIQILSESNQIISYLMMLYMREGDYPYQAWVICCARKTIAVKAANAIVITGSPAVFLFMGRAIGAGEVSGAAGAFMRFRDRSACGGYGFGSSGSVPPR